MTAPPSAGKAFEDALRAAIAEPSIVFDALTQQGVKPAVAAFTVADIYHRLTGTLPIETGQ